MTKISCFIHGSYPRSEKLAQASRDAERKRLTQKILGMRFREDFTDLIKLQKKLNLEFLEDGKFEWQDIFRPIVEVTEGMEVGPLTRWFDNNNFYRQPILKGKFSLDKNKLDHFFPALSKEKWKVTLPSPFTFAKLAGGGSLSFDKNLSEITNVLGVLTAHLEKRGVSFIQFNEPFIPYYGFKKSELSSFIKSFSKLKKTNPNTIFSVQFFFGDCADVVSYLADSGFLGIVGIDFYKTSISKLPRDLPFDIAAGIIESRNSLIESEEVLKVFIEKVVKKIKPDVLYLTNNSDFDLLPAQVANEKLETLGKIYNYYSKI